MTTQYNELWYVKDKMSQENTTNSKNPVPTQVQPQNDLEILLAWDTGEKYSLPYVELRFYCPCASCVDEHTGKRVIERSSISPDTKVIHAQLIGRYALQFTWNDGHKTGMYHFDRLHEICNQGGKRLT